MLTEEERCSLRWAAQTAKITGYREMALIFLQLLRKLSQKE